MAYMHKLTYELLSQNGIESTADEYFEIDDFIALPVQELNRRGYTTMPYCYNGDVFAGTNEATMTNYTEDALKNIGGITGVKVNEDGTANIYFRGETDHHACVVFAEDAPALPSIPDGWEQKANFLEYWFDKELEPFDFMEESVNVMRKLYEWTRALPDLSI